MSDKTGVNFIDTIYKETQQLRIRMNDARSFYEEAKTKYIASAHALDSLVNAVDYVCEANRNYEQSGSKARLVMYYIPATDGEAVLLSGEDIRQNVY